MEKIEQINQFFEIESIDSSSKLIPDDIEILLLVINHNLEYLMEKK